MIQIITYSERYKADFIHTQKDGKGKAAIEREPSQTCLNSAERKQARTKFKADVFANAIKHDHKSPNPTTRWSDVIKLK